MLISYPINLYLLCEFVEDQFLESDFSRNKVKSDEKIQGSNNTAGNCSKYIFIYW
jgi:hypothetical protein